MVALISTVTVVSSVSVRVFSSIIVSRILSLPLSNTMLKVVKK